MKLLHTSDWHLGRTLHGYNLIEDQKYILDQILTYIKAYKIDALIIAGDVYDKSLPNEEAVALFNWFLGEVILGYHIPTFIIAGNHDSNTRIHFGSELFSGQGLHIVGKCREGYKCITLEKEEPVNFYLIPYMEPQEVRELAGDPSIKRHDDAMRYLTGKIEEEKQEGAKIAVVHAFVAGGDLSDSERRLCAVGTAEMVGVDCFKGFTYTALGHLHKPQAIGTEAVRYSGSPLKYSLSEVNQPKGVTCITIEKGELAEVEELPLQPKRNVRLIEGPMAELVKIGATLEEQLKNDYVYARITDRETEDMVGTLRNIYPYILGAEKVAVAG
ncbi:MAG: exonuclease SbcCD subunit D, partial [Cellulosilyticaceae bacterium]